MKLKRILTVIILVLFCATVHPAVAAERTFEWDANTPADAKNGYKAYRSISPDVQKIESNLWLTIWDPGTNPYPADPAHIEYVFTDESETICTITVNVLPPGKYYFRWTAFNIDEESGTSNEVNTRVYDVPDDPTGLRCIKR